MWIEDFSPEIDSLWWIWNNNETIKEISEKFKEETKKAWAKVAKVWKDEKKAKKYDVLLAWFLAKIIVDKKYDFILENLFKSINKWYSSNFILWILSLINIDISNKIREISRKKPIIFNYEIKKEIEEFDNNNINEKIKIRINNWIEDIIDILIIDYSNIQTEKLKSMLKNNNKEKDILIKYTNNIFSFFLKSLNINITELKSQNISNFIISEVEKSINKLYIENI